MGVQRWQFYSPVTGERYDWPRNPEKMTKVRPTRNYTVKHTVGLTGQVLIYEGAPTPADWNCSGKIRTVEHYQALEHWTYDVPGRVQLTDHYGRLLVLQMEDFDAAPVIRNGIYWAHDFTLKAIVTYVGQPTVFTPPEGG